MNHEAWRAKSSPWATLGKQMYSTWRAHEWIGNVGDKQNNLPSLSYEKKEMLNFTVWLLNVYECKETLRFIILHLATKRILKKKKKCIAPIG